MDENIDLFLENKSLKNEFNLFNLDLNQVFIPSPDNPETENIILKELLDWVKKYSDSHNRKEMEKEGYEFPPIEPKISPENDWYLFELWMNGMPVRQKIGQMMQPVYSFDDPDELSDEEIILELQKLRKRLEENHFSIELKEEIPARLIYKYLQENLDEEYEMMIEGVWHLDGCTGYCPDCFQRPWCESGNESCWQEDIDAGKIYFIDSVKKYVSASPVSLQILQKLQSEKDRK